MSVGIDAEGSDLVRQVQGILGKGTPAASFAALLYGRNGTDDVGTLAPASLARNTRNALEFIEQKPAGRAKTRIRRMPAGPDGGPAEMSVVEILNDDMPFLVDSILGELRVRGLDVRVLLHPIYKTRRDASGRLIAIEGPGDEHWGDGHQESYIAIHLDPLSDDTAADLAHALESILADVRIVVADWAPMRQRLKAAVAGLQLARASVPQILLSESVAFLEWLEQDNFTLLGVREYEFDGDPETGDFLEIEGSALGVLRDPGMQVLRRGSELVAMTPEIRRFFLASTPLIITKANVVSRVHRRVHMDYVGIKTYRRNGKPKGEIRVVGLFTSQAYVSTPAQIPFLRHKVEAVLEASGHPPASHAGKALLNILNTFPRDELFQIGVEQLQEWAEGILDLETRPRLRVFARVDRFDRFVSLIVYIPRDRYTSNVRERIGGFLAKTCDGQIVAFYPYFPDGPLVRVQFIVARFAGATPAMDAAELERGIVEIVRTWEDRLAEAIGKAGGDSAELRSKYGAAFSAGYTETFSPERAIEDLRRIERLGPDRPIAIDFYVPAGAAPGRVHAAVYQFGPPLRLSDRVPILENLGFSSIDERTYRIMPRFGDATREVALHDMALVTCNGLPVDLAAHDTRLEGAFLAVFSGEADNDGFNRLVVAAGADWREAALLRAYAAYLRQLGSPFGLRYLADTLGRHAGVARDLLELFHLRFDPDRRLDMAGRKAAEAPIRSRLEGALAAVPSLDEDRILRQFVNLVGATVRTNFYQRRADGQPPAAIVFKLDSTVVDAAPEPRPFREMWVYAPRVEGVHLRFGAIARGGIRWSDRAQDFRTEVLGLVRAQLVKNAVIVPTGAKGGFLPKQLPRAGAREEVLKEGIAAYRMFISALLDLTDNIKDGRAIPPERVVRHDGDDPYLVVAADKGTATFSDIANEISAAHDFWLGDAFASGGSAGYDHKKIAITARGAWECVKRHFREMDVDIQRQPFRVVGVGDMSGDVFGNGMLLSPAIRLIAAFDHRDIFLDPDPDPVVGLAERKRLFDLPRSSWQDYDRAKISQGGGVFSRGAKSIPLSDEIRTLLGIDARAMAPNELIGAVLKCDTDLLWFGGIGTYVRASAETDADVGDRANDPLRVTAAALRAKVIGEGANLGMTQRARIEFAARGGRLNTDFIDNSAGVNTSDQEVNIKIALGPAVRSGRLSTSGRNALLAEMTDDVAAASLRNNCQQSLALSLAERRSARDLPDYALLMRALEGRSLLDRRLEALPSEMEMRERARGGRGLGRPELAVLLSYAKIALLHDILESRVADAPQLEPWLADYFPAALRERFADGIRQHSLRREIAATALTNAVVNRGGPAMAVRLADEAGRTTPDVAQAFLAAREVFDLPRLWRRIDALDGKVKGEVQLELYQATQDLVQQQTRWFMHDGRAVSDLAGTIARHKAGVAELAASLDTILPAADKARVAEARQGYVDAGVPADVGVEVASLGVFGLAPAITEIAAETGAGMLHAARAYLDIGERLHLADLTAKAGTIATSDYYDRLAISQALAQLAGARAALTREALRSGDGSGGRSLSATPSARLEGVEATLAAITQEEKLTVSRLLVAAGQLGSLAEVSAAAPSASARPGR